MAAATHTHIYEGVTMSRHTIVAESFVDRQHAISGSMVSTGHEVFSYRECIAKVTGPDSVDVRREKFSVTTSRHQNAVRRALENAGYEHVAQGDTSDWECWTR